MEDELWMELYRIIMDSGKGKRRKRQRFADREIVLVYLWAVLHDRPVCWACQRRNWPTDSPLRAVPSDSTMSRRLRTGGAQAILDLAERDGRQRIPRGLCKYIDAMPLVIGNASTDPQAGYGRAASGKAKGYKLYAILDAYGGIDAWRVCPMNVSEKKMARRLVRDAPGPGYLIGDGEYDDSILYAWAARQQYQLVAPKHRGKGLGHRRQRPERLRGIAIQRRAFGRGLLAGRVAIDRFFGGWRSWSCGLKSPPAWVRTLPRVRRWVQAKLILYYVWQREKQRLTA
jgi:hypothetical protein